MNNRARVYVGVLLAMIFWSLSFVWFKMANETFRPITIVFTRLVMSVFIMGVYIIVKKKLIRIKKPDRILFCLLALFEPFFYFLGESFGLTYVSATVGSVLISTIPVFAALGAWIIFRERLKFINYAGIILSFIGVLIFIVRGDGTISFSSRGLLLLMLAVFSAVGYNLTLSRLVGSYSPVLIVTVQNSLGAVLFLPIFLISDFSHLMNTAITINSILPIIELSVFASCGAFIFFAFSVRNIGITRANVFTNFIPVFTAVFSFVLLGDTLSFQNIIGMLIVIGGVYMAQMNGRQKKTEEALVLTGKTA
jgi:drug/metabolite transporter (DMT)-like permease